MFWSVPVGPADSGRPLPQAGLLVLDALESSRAPAILLGKDDGRVSLIIGPSQSGPGRIVPMNIDAFGLQIVEGVGNTLWIGGTKNVRYTWWSIRLSDGYLAKLDRQGRLEWERTFGADQERTIEGLASLPSGDIVVVGKDNDFGWLAGISGDGHLLWERSLNLGRQPAILVADNRIFVAAFDLAVQRSESAHYGVVLWTFDEFGNLLDKRRVREALNRSRYQGGEAIWMRRFQNSIYLISTWSSGKAIDIANLDLLGKLVWERQAGPGEARCRNAPIVMSSGDVLLACYAIRNRSPVHRFNRRAGDVSVTYVPIPACDPDSRLFLRQESSSSTWMVGSSPKGFSYRGCTWLGEFKLRSEGD